ncbi:MAG: ABC transporter ATP-binding protein [Tissierellia bacterium]|nr:ABC transporter ATP-binding protein [Tissierellia bacterium]
MTILNNKKIVLKTENITKSFDGVLTLKDISIILYEGELVSILGKSGGGKSTLFNIISGLLEPDEGRVLLGGKDITTETGHMSYMLQKDLLLPHLKVLDNVAIPLIINGMNKKAARLEASTHFEEFGLQGTEHQYPAQLSGGMKQRAALLRTYLFSKEVCLLDEPFSALDTITKASIHSWYLDIMKKIKLSTLFITHDIDEAIKLSDRIYILGANPGHIAREFIIDSQEKKNLDFTLSSKFLEYKRAITEAIES